MFSDQVILVTGGARGIGKAIAERFLRLGGTVYVLDQHIPESWSDADGMPLKGDITQADDVAAAVRTIMDRSGRIDVLVNNAGITRDHVIWKMSEEEFDRVLEVNLKGAWLMSRAVIPLMRERRYGRIVNIASRAWLGNPGQSNYAASKGGLVSLTRVLALELANRNVTVNTVAPGLIRTPLTEALKPEVWESLVQKQPGGQVGTPEDVATAVTFFASREAQFITGQLLYVDGGRSVGAGAP